MIHISKKEECCGCEACVQVCPKDCIQMKKDREGFLYPFVEVSSCIDCGACERVCPILNPYQKREPIQLWAAKTENENIRLQSSSGGVFSELALWIIRKGGVVFGAHFTKNWIVEHTYVETEEELSALRGSKYVQSHIKDSYKQVLSFLKQDRWVLFSGTSCQVTALNRFLKKKYDKLLTVEVVCHGVPSAKVWDKYLKEITGGKKQNILGIEFRNKTTGWINYSFVCRQKGGDCSTIFRENPYMKGFVRDLYLRPSCYYCSSKSFATESDVALAVYWGIQQLQPYLNDDLGISAVFVHSSKTEKIIKEMPLCLEEVAVPLSTMVEYNKCISYSSRKGISLKRKLFFWGIDYAIPFSWLVNSLSKKWGLISFVKKFIRRN